ncbi:MAG: hypothetical protein EOO16_18420 [Chitinophagaceae bacterium]|nr:MAG: hypothetical protein EOO16_18420 [Chitinophagaceae bacterium]
MKLIYIGAVMAALLHAPAAQAQRPVEASFATWLESLPMPRADMGETAAAFPDMDGTEKGFRTAFQHIHEPITALRQSFHERFREDLDKPAASLPAGERQLLDRYRTGAKGLGKDGSLSLFTLLFEDRPQLAAQQLSWDKPGPLSAAAAAQYRTLLDIERSLNWPAFHADMQKEGPLALLSRRDAVVEALNASFAKQQAAVPKKQVKMMAGSDVTAEMSDPEAMLRLLKEQRRQLSAHLQKTYGQRYAWFRERFDRVQAAALRLEGLLQETGYGARLHGADAGLQAPLAGLQLRVWEMAHYLHAIAEGLVQQARIDSYAQAQTEEGIRMYEKLARGEGMAP